MPRFYIVEICHITHPEAEKLKQANKDMGYHVYCFRGTYVLILGGERVWGADESHHQSHAETMSKIQALLRA